MPIEHKLQRWYEDKHEEHQHCKANGSHGRCPYQVVEGTTYCPRHGGVLQQNKIEKEKANAYRIQVWQNRIDEFAEDEKVKSLRAEVAILRMTLENVLNQCTTSTELLINSSKISDLVTKIEKLVVSCDRIETRMGVTLDKSAVLSFASRVVALISEHIDDPRVIDAISDGIIDSLKEIT